MLQKHRVFCQLPNGDWALCTVITTSGDESVLKVPEGKVSYLKSAWKILLSLWNYYSLTPLLPIEASKIENGEPSTCKSWNSWWSGWSYAAELSKWAICAVQLAVQIFTRHDLCEDRAEPCLFFWSSMNFLVICYCIVD